MAKLLNVFPKSLQYLAHCFDKGGEENQINTAEICDWWNFLPNPPPSLKKKREKSFHTIMDSFFIYPQKETFAPTQNETIMVSLKRKRSDSLL